MVEESKPNYPQKKEIQKQPIAKRAGAGAISDFGFSISKPGNIGKTETKKSDAPPTEAIDKTAAKELFTIEKLLIYWTEFATSLTKPSQIPAASILNSSKPTLSGTEQLLLELHSKTQEAEFDKIKPILIPFLRKSLNNYHLGITITVNTDSKNLTPYTAEEKFKFMAEKNDSLNKLRTELNLDLGH